MFSRPVVVFILLALTLTGCKQHTGLFGPSASITTETIVLADRPHDIDPAANDAMVEPAAFQLNAAPSRPYLLDTGDRIRIFVYGQPNLSRGYSVDAGGFISMPLIGAVRARGTTTYELERSIRSQLAADYIRDPKVSVEISVNRPFFVLGEVRDAGQFPYVNNMSAQTAIAIAGGYTARANERKIQISRPINGGIETMHVDPATPIQPGDTVYVMERFF